MKITANRPDMVVMQKLTKQMYVVEMSCPGETNIAEKELEKRAKYRDLIFQLKNTYPEYKTIFIPIIIGVMGGIHPATLSSLKLIKEIAATATTIIQQMQKFTILGSLRILRAHEASHPPPLD